MSSSTYVSPFGGSGVTTGRTDQGVDFSAPVGSAIRAIGKALVLHIDPNFYRGQPAIYYQLLEGPDKGKVVYASEQITPQVKAGDVVSEGQTIGVVAPSGTGLEIGWGTTGGVPLAQSTGGYTEGAETPAGKSFSSFVKGLGSSGGGQSFTGGVAEGFLSPENLAVPGLGLLDKGLHTLGIPDPFEVAGKGLGLLDEGAEAARKALGIPSPSELAVNTAKGVVGYGFGLVSPILKKVAVYGVLILGAVAMVIYGLSKTLEPVGGPNLKHEIGKGARGAAIAGAAAA